MAKRELPSPEVLRQLLRYEPETGKLFWKERGPEWFEGGVEYYQRRWNTRYAGMPALDSRANAFGHLGGTIFNRSFHAHRVIWAMTSGSWPDMDIDHINGDPKDNRITNLRLVTRAVNSRNRSVSTRSKTGHLGVSRYGNKWVASIRAEGRQDYLGVFRCVTAAIFARKKASHLAGFHENHGRPKLK